MMSLPNQVTRFLMNRVLIETSAVPRINLVAMSNTVEYRSNEYLSIPQAGSYRTDRSIVHGARMLQFKYPFRP